MQYNGSQTVLDIRDDLGATMNECREVTEKYRTGPVSYTHLDVYKRQMYRCAIREIQTKLEVLDDEFSAENKIGRAHV